MRIFSLLILGVGLLAGQVPDPDPPTLCIIGDSTVRNGRGDGGGGLWGWGEPVAAYFEASRINVANRALGGRSSRTYISEGHWEKALSILKPGDFVLIQFGHNDSSPVNDASRARGAIKGVGDESREIDNLLNGKHEVVHTYGWYLKRYIRETRDRGATPIVCSPVPRNNWKDGHIVADDYRTWAEEVARSEKALFIDLNQIITRRYEAMGSDAVARLFPTDHTHTNLAGAEINAESVIAGLKALPGNPLAKFFSDKAR